MRKHLNNEEFWNVVTHALGVLLSVLGATYLIYLAFQKESSLHLAAIICFSLSMILLYTASTVYHLYSFRKKEDSLALQRFDHIAIYYLIAGTYTPFTLIVLEQNSGFFILTAVWILAFLGTLYKIFFLNRYKWFSLMLYLFMGWFILFDISSFIQLSNATTLWFLLLGGLAYTLGTIFYTNHKIPYNHSIWHGFVLAGTIFHYFSILWLF
jgi:hemolysin III